MSETTRSLSDDECLEFPDIYRKVPTNATTEERQRIQRQNDERERLYRAVRYVLIHNFGFRDGVPDEPKNFPGSNLSPGETARFCAVYGQLLADNWIDPSLGRQIANDDDLVVPGGSGAEVVIVTRRFVDAVVEAVKGHAANAQLYLKVFGFLREAGTQDNQSRRSA